MQLDVSPETAETLREILVRALGDLREEIYKAEVADYKAGLKRREAVIQSLLDQLKALAA